VVKLTDTHIKKLKPAPRYYDVTDDGTSLFVRVKADGSKEWFWRGLREGRRSKWPIGLWPEMSVTDARATANALNSEAKKAKALPTPRAVQAVKALTVNDAFKLYFEAHACNLARGGAEIESTMRLRILPTFGDRTLVSLTRRELNEHFNAMRSLYKGVGINRVLAHLKAFLSWCVDEDLIEANPAITIPLKAPVVIRRVSMKDDQLGFLMLALDGMGRYCDPLKLLLYTCVRMEMIFGLKWGEVVTRSDGVIELHIEKSKAGVPHIVVLTEPAAKLLPQRPENAFDSHRVFDVPVDKMGKTSRGGKRNHKMRKLASDHAAKARRDMPNFDTHDFRKIASTWFGDQLGREELIFSDRALKILMTHIPQDVTNKHYNQSSCFNERVKMLNAWSNHLEKCREIVSERCDSNNVILAKAA